tara:strand:- start:327 stop:761 length:435 start_codon:yes stop_codon:yes gene_type:complete
MAQPYEKFGSRNFVASSSTAGNGEGDVIFIGETTVSAGGIYYFTSLGSWAFADADVVASSSTLLAVALGSGAANAVGMLLRGMVTLSSDPGEGTGLPLYLSVTAGRASRTAPSGSGDIVRVIGYNIANGGYIWFNPDNTFVELA